MLVALLFAQKNLPFGPNLSLDHVEAFAGEHSVTIGEMEDSRISQTVQSDNKKHDICRVIFQGHVFRTKAISLFGGYDFLRRQ